MTKETLDTIKDIIILGITPIVISFIAYKQIKLNHKQTKIAEKVDGMTSALVVAEKGKSHAEGQLTEIDKAKQEAIDTGKTVIATGVQEVKIVEQAKPLDVKVKKDTDKT